MHHKIYHNLHCIKTSSSIIKSIRNYRIARACCLLKFSNQFCTGRCSANLGIRKHDVAHCPCRCEDRALVDFEIGEMETSRRRFHSTSLTCSIGSQGCAVDICRMKYAQVDSKVGFIADIFVDFKMFKVPKLSKSKSCLNDTT